jgi:hypothetical protein
LAHFLEIPKIAITATVLVVILSEAEQLEKLPCGCHRTLPGSRSPTIVSFFHISIGLSRQSKFSFSIAALQLENHRALMMINIAQNFLSNNFRISRTPVNLI